MSGKGEAIGFLDLVDDSKGKACGFLDDAEAELALQDNKKLAKKLEKDKKQQEKDKKKKDEKKSKKK